MNSWGETLIAAGAVTASAAAHWLAPIIAQAAGQHHPTLPNIDFGNLTATAILGWYAWHTQTRTIPKMQDDFRSAIEKQRDDFREELIAERTAIARIETKIEGLRP